MRRIVRLVIVLSVLAGLAAPVGMAAERMWVGFHDDPSYRWVPIGWPERSERRVTEQPSCGCSCNGTSPRRSGPRDRRILSTRQYVFDDVDEAVRAAQENGQEVILTISGTPRWANGGKNPNVMPTRVADFTSFARAISSRYSGRFQGYPFVRFWSIWNEPNLQLFLSPQFDARGRSVAPANYARLYAAGHAGIKAGNALAKVAIGETSARGSDKPTGLRPTHTPGKFAELVAKANPRLKFDAWSHHPYPFNPNSPPTQLVKWPNVSLASLPRFNDNLKKWFKRKSVPIWITEYGHQTRPEDSLGVPYSRQAAYIRQSIALATRLPFVEMFIWFVYQDDQGQPWESGLYTRSGALEGLVAGCLPPGRGSGRCAKRGLRVQGRHDDAARPTVRPPLLRERRGRHADRDDLACVPGGPPDSGRPAELAASTRLHDHRPTPFPGQRHREGCYLYGDVRAERRERHSPRSPADDPRNLI